MRDLTRPDEGEDKWASLIAKLDETQSWPGGHTFKFIVPSAEAANLCLVLNEFATRLTERASSSGKYVSMTLTAEFASAEAVIDIYKRVAVIKGIITL